MQLECEAGKEIVLIKINVLISKAVNDQKCNGHQILYT